MANWVLGHTNRFKCIVSHDGMFNPESAYGTTEELWFNEWEFGGQSRGITTTSRTRKTPTASGRPMLAAKNFKTPTLVVHGQARLPAGCERKAFSFSPRCSGSACLVRCCISPMGPLGAEAAKTPNSGIRRVNDWVDEWTKASGQ